MTPTEQKTAAKQFVERWQQAQGSEDKEARSYWIELCQNVLGIVNPTQKLDFERKVKDRRIDVFYEDMGVLIENKSRGIGLDAPEQRGKDKHGNPRMVTPYEQAKWYADNITPRSIAPKWIVTCNFDCIRIYDLDDEDAEDNYEAIELSDLPNLVHRLSFLTRKENSRMEREKDLSVKAGEVVGKLYDAFSKAYLDIEKDEREQRSLNVLITRIVFLLYAEDADLLQERNAFYLYLKNFQVEHMRMALRDLFDVLRTPDDERDPYLRDELKAFPYVNGGLFANDIIIPQFTQDTRFILLQEASADFDWSGISPTIFGAVFESTLNPETRRSSGMHYTSVENIHRLTGPLFYDALKDELTAIEGLKTEKERRFKLNAFRAKIASLKFLDPACGSGNFLTETYLSLRKLENRVLEDIYGGQMVIGEIDPIQVSLDQFYGIEINDFAVEVAKTALWIAELQMLDQTREILSMWIDPLPLKSNDNIVCANALRTDWNDVLPAEECNYIIGNPPFHGELTKEQIADRTEVFGKSGGVLDYVACWYKRATEYAINNSIQSAFVSTNSICQGQQVEPLWHPLFDAGISINFAYRPFVWKNEATTQAHVHVVIIGFSHTAKKKTVLYNADGTVTEAANINGYLMAADNYFVQARSKPLCDVPQMVRGGGASDWGFFMLDEAERKDLIAREPEAERWIRPFMQGNEFIKKIPRYCIWLEGATPAEIEALPLVAERVENVRHMRLGSKKAATRKKAETPWLFDEIIKVDSPNYIAVPQVSSQRRTYIPMGYVDSECVAGNKLLMVPNGTLYELGVMSSQVHNAWMRVVCGRMKSDYQYSATIVYNSFPWPTPTEEQRASVMACARAVLDARAKHPNSTYAQMYDGISPVPEGISKSDEKKFDRREYDDLKVAHAALDAAVEAAYGVNFNGDEEKIVAHLFKLYAEATESD